MIMPVYIRIHASVPHRRRDWQLELSFKIRIAGDSESPLVRSDSEIPASQVERLDFNGKFNIIQ